MSEPTNQNSLAADSTPLQRDRNANRGIVHLNFLARRLEGGASATPEAYASALQQWQQLPGAVVSAPLTVLLKTQAAPTPTDTGAAVSAPAGTAPHEEHGP